MATTKKVIVQEKAPKVMTTEEFNKLPKAEQRVMIAEDVIAQIKARVYKPMQSVYVSMAIPRGVKSADDAQSNLHKVRNCTVCGIGACLISATKFKNTLTIEEMSCPISDDDTKKKARKLLESAFTPNQLAAIESAFEKGYNPFGFWSTSDREGGGMKGRLTGQMASKVESFGNQYSKDNKRLIAIMSNIIANKGTFKP